MTSKELYEFMRNIGQKFTEAEVEQTIKEVDPAGNASIDLPQLSVLNKRVYSSLCLFVHVSSLWVYLIDRSSFRSSVRFII